ncbi:MAG: helix-turn-helix domain-containing protein [Lachnospiraceae bacterium]|nr:helix-turn-helix domain-containing protein [Lachnospiraceae bacterium]
MNSIGSTIKCLRKAMGVTQEELAGSLGVTYQAVSKWENDTTLPDIMMIPALATYFGVTTDELFGYKLNVMTDKERLINFMIKNQILCRKDVNNVNDVRPDYYINSERFTTNAQISKIGEAFADCIRENHLEFDTIMGLAYHGIGFSAATAVALYQKYGVTTHYCYDRQRPDSRGRILCGHTPQTGERLIIIDDVMGTGRSMDERISQLRAVADVRIEAIIVIVNRCHCLTEKSGTVLMKEKYGANVYSLITDYDIQQMQKSGMIIA